MTVTPQPENATPAATTAGEKSSMPPVTVIVMLLSTIGLFALIAVFAGNRNPFPLDTSAEAGFARDMILHHSQAVDMGLLLYNRTDNETLKSIGIDIVMTQQNQVGQMQGWLDLWGLTYSGAALPMTWMDTPVEGLMPGIASDDRMEALRSSTGVDADRLFVELMIPHHQAGVHMAEAILNRTGVATVQRFARNMIETQQREIAELTLIAAEIGANVVPLDLDHEQHED